MNNKPYRVAAILGLECGRRTCELLKQRDDIEFVAVFGLSPEKSAGVAGYVDIGPTAGSVPYHYYHSIRNAEDALIGLGELDLIIAIGISDILKEPLLSFPKRGVLGAHAAKLPDRPGCAPLVWAILDDLKESAMTLIRLEEAIDRGKIFADKAVVIDPEETGGTLRHKMDDALDELLDVHLSDILSGANEGEKQNEKGVYTRRRGPKDGELNLGASADEILKKIRALSSPYPGVHFYAGDGKPVVIENAHAGDETLIYNREKKEPRTVVCVAAHPDDEALGVGGTLIRHAVSGDMVHVIILSEGEDSKQNPENCDPERRSHAAAWCEEAGCCLHAIHDFPDQGLDAVPQLEIVQQLERDFRLLNPDIVYIHHPGDMNSDHQIAAQTALAALRPMACGEMNPEILAYETPSSTDQAPQTAHFAFLPNHYVDISGVWDKKISALNVYEKELGEPPHPRSLRSIKALAVKRGAESGLMKAEAFVLLRRVCK